MNQALIGAAVRRVRPSATATRSRRSIARCASGWSQVSTLTSPRKRTPSARKGLVHGDYRLDNMLFGEPGADRPLTVVDWQTVTWGPRDDRCRVFPRLRAARRRCAATTTTRCCGPTTTPSGPNAPISLDDVRDGVRRQSFFGVMMAIVSSMLVARTDRGDEMFMVMLQRHCQHVLDTDALAVLPDPSVCRRAAHACGRGRGRRMRRPTSRCGTRAGTSTSPMRSRASAAGYGWGSIRISTPHGSMRCCAVPICRRSRSTTSRPRLPDDPGAVRTDAIDLALDATEPLRTYRVKVRGRGQAYDDPAALLRGEAGRPVELTMDLVWTTAGTPYQYRITPRYEIPCTVSGTVVVDGRESRRGEVAGSA